MLIFIVIKPVYKGLYEKDEFKISQLLNWQAEAAKYLEKKHVTRQQEHGKNNIM